MVDRIHSNDPDFFKRKSTALTQAHDIADVMDRYLKAGDRERFHRAAVSLIYFAVRDVGRQADITLAEQGLSRTHFRALFFIHFNPGLTLRELTPILEISHQALSKVVGDLIRDGYLEQVTGERDRRQRLLHLTIKGRKLEKLIMKSQGAALEVGYDACGPIVAADFCRFLASLLKAEDRQLLGSMFEGNMPESA